MGIFGSIISWLFSGLFAALAVLIWGMGGKLHVGYVAGIALLLMPPVRGLIQHLAGRVLPWWVYAAAGVVLWCGMLASMALNPAKSIYKSEKAREQLQELYDHRLAQWPVPYEERYVDTEYGRIHMIVSGPQDGFPVLLIHASALSGWSWIYNVGAWNTRFRTYAVDNIGEGGKNAMKKPGYIPKTGPEIAAYYSAIMDRLGIVKAHVVGASIGGYMSTQIAIYAPERVEKVVLLGPMGYGFTLKTVFLMMLAQGFPIKPVQDATFRWAFGEAPVLEEGFGQWFRIYMKGLVPTPVPPASLKAEDLAKVQAPVLAYFGTRDSVVGDARKAETLAGNIPLADVRIVESGHLMGAELAGTLNPEMLDFLTGSSAAE